MSESSFTKSDENTLQFRTLDYFTEVDGFLTNGQNGKVFRCKHCDHVFQRNISVNHYSDHITNKHGFKFIRRSSNLEKEKIQAIDHALIFFLIFSFSPFSIVCNKYFINFVKELNPEYRLPDRKTLNKLLWQIYDEYKEYAKNYFQTIKWVHSTCDTWTSCANNNYLGVTIHFLDDIFQLKSFTLSLKNVLGEHKAENLNYALQNVFEEFSIKDKVISINSDNANNMRKALKLYQDDEGLLLISGRCMGHTLQLIVELVIETLEKPSASKADKKMSETILAVISKCKDLTTSFNHSSQLTEQLIQKQLENGKNKNNAYRVIQEVKTRWHSLFLCLQRILLLHKYISDILMRFFLFLCLILSEDPAFITKNFSNSIFY